MKSGRGGLKIKREERLGPKKVVGMGEGSYIRDSRHLTSLLSHVWGNVEMLGQRRNVASNTRVDSNGGTKWHVDWSREKVLST